MAFMRQFSCYIKFLRKVYFTNAVEKNLQAKNLATPSIQKFTGPFYVLRYILAYLTILAIANVPFHTY